MGGSEVRLFDFESVCLACLTKTKMVKSLSEEIYSKADWKRISLKEALNTLLNGKVLEGEHYPTKICAVCTSFLKMAYNFKKQCESSQSFVLNMLENVNTDDREHSSDVVEILEEVDTDRLDHSSQENLNNFTLGSKKSPVELVVKGASYSLSELVIVEEEDQTNQTKHTFSGFLRNLGTEISAKFVSKSSYRFQVPKHDKELSFIVKNKYNVVPEIQENAAEHKETELNIFNDDLPDLDSIESVPRENEPSEVGSDPEIPPLYQCNICLKTYNIKESLRRHKRRVHNKKGQRQCDVCGHVAVSPYALNLHKEKHGERRHICHICDKRYYHRGQLRAHLNTHSRNRVYLCSVCGRTFLYAIALKYHSRVHTGQRDFLCRYCGKSFAYESSFNSHIRTHTGAKPYKCKFCDRRFASRTGITCHEMSHTGRRPFRCIYCDKGFQTAHTVKMHVMTHAGAHQCEMCPKSFVEVNFLKIHMMSVHDIDFGNESVSLSKIDLTPYKNPES